MSILRKFSDSGPDSRDVDVWMDVARGGGPADDRRPALPRRAGTCVLRRQSAVISYNTRYTIDYYIAAGNGYVLSRMKITYVIIYNVAYQ